MKVTNTSGARQGVHTTKGIAWLKPGESRDELVLSRSQAEKARRLSFLKIEGEPVDDLPSGGEAGDTEAMTGMRQTFDAAWAELTAKAKGLEQQVTDLQQEVADRDTMIANLRAQIEGGEGGGASVAKTPAEVIAMADDGTPFMSFKAEATKLLGEKTPAKKDDILAALKAL